MGLSKEIILTVKDYEIKLNRDIKFYENDTIDLCFSILEYGIKVKDGVAVNSLMPINALRAYMLIETPQGVDYAESTKVENNRVIFNLGNKYSQFIGIGRMQIIIKDNDGCRITLPEFPFEIRESINSNWDKDITALSTENNEIIIDEFGRRIELKKISEMEEANILPIDSYSMILDNNGNKKIKTNLITQKIENDLQLVNEQLDNITSRIEYIENNGSGGGSTGGSLNLRDVLDGEIFTIETIDKPTNPTETYGQIIVSKLNTTITEGGTDSFTVNLDKAPTNNQIITLSKDNSNVTLNTYSLTFTPSNYAIAQTVTITVAEDDTDYSNETCNITLTSPNVTSKSLLVDIIDNDTAPDNIPVSGVSLDVTNYNLKVGETVQLTYTVSPDNATNKSVTWSTNNSNCTVVEGLVTAETEGDCIITCTTVDGNHMATCNITVVSNEGTGVVTINNLLEKSDTFETSTVGGMKWQKYNIDFQVIEAGHCKVTGNKEGANGLFKYSITANSITDIPNNTTHIFFSKYEKSTDGIAYDIRVTKYGTITSATTFVSETGIAYGSSVWVKNAILIDLTEEYGSGNEPSEEECIAKYLNVWNA